MGMHTSLMTVNGKDLLNFSTCRPPHKQVRIGMTLLRISANILYKGYQQAWYSMEIHTVSWVVELCARSAEMCS